MQKTIAIVSGTGAKGFGLASRFAHASARVIVGSRDAAKAQDALVGLLWTRTVALFAADIQTSPSFASRSCD